MVRIKNVSPFGDLDVPLLGRVVPFGDVFDAPEDVAVLLIGQPTNWVEVVRGAGK